MVFKEKIKAELKAYARFLREEGDVPVKEIVHHSGIPRAAVYRCLKSILVTYIHIHAQF